MACSIDKNINLKIFNKITVRFGILEKLRCSEDCFHSFNLIRFLVLVSNKNVLDFTIDRPCFEDGVVVDELHDVLVVGHSWVL